MNSVNFLLQPWLLSSGLQWKYWCPAVSAVVERFHPPLPPIMHYLSVYLFFCTHPWAAASLIVWDWNILSLCTSEWHHVSIVAGNILSPETSHSHIYLSPSSPSISLISWIVNVVWNGLLFPPCPERRRVFFTSGPCRLLSSLISCFYTQFMWYWLHVSDKLSKVRFAFLTITVAFDHILC